MFERLKSISRLPINPDHITRHIHSPKINSYSNHQEFLDAIVGSIHNNSWERFDRKTNEQLTRKSLTHPSSAVRGSKSTSKIEKLSHLSRQALIIYGRINIKLRKYKQLELSRVKLATKVYSKLSNYLQINNKSIDITKRHNLDTLLDMIHDLQTYHMEYNQRITTEKLKSKAISKKSPHQKNREASSEINRKLIA